MFHSTNHNHHLSHPQKAIRQSFLSQHMRGKDLDWEWELELELLVQQWVLRVVRHGPRPHMNNMLVLALDHWDRRHSPTIDM